MTAPYFGTFAQGEYICAIINDELLLCLKQEESLYELKTNFENLPEEIKREVDNIQDLHEYICNSPPKFNLREGRFFLVMLAGLRRREKEVQMNLQRLEALPFYFLQANNQRLQQKLKQILSRCSQFQLQNKQLKIRVCELEEKLQQSTKRSNKNKQFIQQRPKYQNQIEKLQRELNSLKALHNLTVRQNLQKRKIICDYQTKFEILSYRQSEEYQSSLISRQCIKISQETDQSETREFNQSQLAEGPESRIFSDDENHQNGRIMGVEQINQTVALQFAQKEKNNNFIERSNRLNRITDPTQAQKRSNSQPNSIILFQQKRKDAGQNILTLRLNNFSSQIKQRYNEKGLIGPFSKDQKHTIYSQPIFTNLDAPIIKVRIISSKKNHLFIGLTSKDKYADQDLIMINMQGVINVGPRATEYSFKHKNEIKDNDTIELKTNFKKWQCSFYLNNNFHIETVKIPPNLKNKVIYFYATLFQNTIIQI